MIYTIKVTMENQTENFCSMIDKLYINILKRYILFNLTYVTNSGRCNSPNKKLGNSYFHQEMQSFKLIVTIHLRHKQSIFLHTKKGKKSRNKHITIQNVKE